ncbi:hypothetical protein FB45DRAFT_1028417 [Roridomyces roridus]|uniref:CFEM domain-containing protein n=1 Tax=Roridomyces roridus TaxID=1738132 RepID=A0AAD7BQS8_9AGAR|nr:hypothetical protein FB45DRAFT_1028417 [Roridomyces roridus]
MRFPTALASFALFATTASASVTPSVAYHCANICLANANTGGCSPGDDSCLCNNSVFDQSTFQCIEGICQGADLTNAIQAFENLCAAVGVPVSPN